MQVTIFDLTAKTVQPNLKPCERVCVTVCGESNKRESDSEANVGLLTRVARFKIV